MWIRTFQTKPFRTCAAQAFGGALVFEGRS
jgi:hypothetical protein